MRKFGLSAFIVVAFVAYSFYVHSQGMDTMPVVAPKILSSGPTSIVTPSPTAPPPVPTQGFSIISILNQNPTPTPTSVPQIVPIITSPPKTYPTATPTPQPAPTATPTSPPASSGYKTGTYTGNVTDAFYGNVQVQATIQNGKITNVQFLQYPNDRQNSIMINSQAMPILNQEAIQAQSAQVDIVSGATDTSNAFIASLGSALAQAK